MHTSPLELSYCPPQRKAVARPEDEDSEGEAKASSPRMAQSRLALSDGKRASGDRAETSRRCSLACNLFHHSSTALFAAPVRPSCCPRPDTTPLPQLYPYHHSICSQSLSRGSSLELSAELERSLPPPTTTSQQVTGHLDVSQTAFAAHWTLLTM